MDGWTDGWKSAWMDGGVEGWMLRRWMCGEMDGWLDGWVNAGIEGEKSRRMNDRLTEAQILFYLDQTIGNCYFCCLKMI